MARFPARMLQAALLDTNVYEEVEADTRANGQAVAVVVLSSLAAGIGSGARGGPSSVLLGTFVVLIGWCSWAYLTYIIGTKFLAEPDTRADYGELLRTIGFSSAPGVLRILGLIPGLTGPVFFVVSIWMLVAMIVAVRQALDYTSTIRAFGVCVIGWIVVALLILLLTSSLSGAGFLAP
jgi:hypothetical protein